MTRGKTHEETGHRSEDRHDDHDVQDPQSPPKKYTDKGFVLISRKWLGRELAQCPGAFTVYFHLLAWANYEDGKLRKGQLALGERDFGFELGMSVTTVRKWLRWLQANGWIALQPKRWGKQRGTIVTVLRYQDSQNMAVYKCPADQQEHRLVPLPPATPPTPGAEFYDTYVRVAGKHFATPETAKDTQSPA